ncbi:hypothetical protein Nstercoris_01776 [Nitrosomonas stercoris]|uniref:Alginate export domain-containing protein n=1 Tax=Nitrosomonas stercoris TaxID=1444684 RepID=A0A4Y1YNW3_9PROT|nr:hypothetical protein Nstercoris_01776 [Nitrosomonas stercoris]
MSAYQFGRWTNLSHRAWALDAEIGYQWNKLLFRPWIRIVYYRSSGDDDMIGIFSVAPSGRLYAKFPFYNQMNIQDIFLEFIVFPTLLFGREQQLVCFPRRFLDGRFLGSVLVVAGKNYRISRRSARASVICRKLAGKLTLDSGYRSMIFWYGAALERFSFN